MRRTKKMTKFAVMRKLILFTNTYPYGTGETFLHEELPYIAGKFDKILLYPLYIPGGEKNISRIPVKPVPANVTIRPPLLHCDHKDKKGLLAGGLLPRLPFTSLKEFFRKKVFLSGRRLWIYFNYTFILNAMRGNKKVLREIEREAEGTDIAYFYWGDKSALLIPYLRKKIKNPPRFVVRFHGSDLYEEAKGYLPYRDYLYKSINYAVPISNNGAEYIRLRYPHSRPEHIAVYRLGSYPHGNGESLPGTEVFHILSCSNVIPLKRVEMIAAALLKIEQDISFIERMEETGYKRIKWTHIGDGPVLESVKQRFGSGTSLIIPVFTGSLAHDEVIEFYNTHRTELFIQVSRSEGIPVSIMEALSFGIPVIATKVGGVEELFRNTAEGRYGFLLPPDLSVEQLEKAIKEYILLPDKQQEAARAAARQEWETNWNSVKNYTGFAEFLATLK